MSSLVWLLNISVNKYFTNIKHKFQYIIQCNYSFPPKIKIMNIEDLIIL